jgi:hypothetical protein
VKRAKRALTPRPPTDAPPAALLGATASGQGETAALMMNAMNMLLQGFGAMLQGQQQPQSHPPTRRKRSAVVGGGPPRAVTDLVLYTGSTAVVPYRDVAAKEYGSEEPQWRGAGNNSWGYTQRDWATPGNNWSGSWWDSDPGASYASSSSSTWWDSGASPSPPGWADSWNTNAGTERWAWSKWALPPRP